ncbi:hypothetical protein ACM43_15835 [Bradyrhizobium sp. CCBAU 45321]|uniref:hypothetical protein n=1 Tax=Bradyrhizobium sp. CCBAU 45321 TaxID=1641878 RepID=UPI002304BBEE|nr:hypothetical protein [Bradyrhizobium sp. CCBAU 45321]MDA9545862.1 hypothetical protein [Bradyrhizobium sp. CCBAU 45321]
MSNSVTGLEGILANRLLGGMADEHETEVISPTQRDAEYEAYKAALRLTKRQRLLDLAMTTSASDPHICSGLAGAGSRTFGGWLTKTAALDYTSIVEPSVLQYFETVQGLINPAESVLNAIDAMQAHLVQHTPHSEQKFKAVDWLNDAFEELNDALECEDATELGSETKAVLAQLGQSVLAEAAAVGAEAPSTDIDPQGNLNLFWKREAEGLLVVVRPDRTIHFFGSSAGDSFRADYAMNGKTWRTHLNFYLQPFRNDDAA